MLRAPSATRFQQVDQLYSSCYTITLLSSSFPPLLSVLFLPFPSASLDDPVPVASFSSAYQPSSSHQTFSPRATLHNSSSHSRLAHSLYPPEQFPVPVVESCSQIRSYRRPRVSSLITFRPSASALLHPFVPSASISRSCSRVRCRRPEQKYRLCGIFRPRWTRQQRSYQSSNPVLSGLRRTPKPPAPLPRWAFP